MLRIDKAWSAGFLTKYERRSLRLGKLAAEKNEVGRAKVPDWEKLRKKNWTKEERGGTIAWGTTGLRENSMRGEIRVIENEKGADPELKLWVNDFKYLESGQSKVVCVPCTCGEKTFGTKETCVVHEVNCCRPDFPIKASFIEGLKRKGEFTGHSPR